MKICGIDASTRKTGISLLEDGKLIEYRLLDYSREKDLDKRIRKMTSSINELLNYFNPNLILCEDVYNDKNKKTFKYLARLGGTILMWAIIKQVDIQYVLPSHWRGIVGIKTGKDIKRDQLKKDAVKIVKKDYNLDVTDDEAEAILIGASGFVEQEELFE